MFGAIKKLFKRAGSGSKDSSADAQSVAEQSPSNYDSSAEEAPTYSAGAAGEGGDSLRVSLKALVALLPKELHGKNPPSAGEALFLSRHEVMEQLAQGAVKIPFGTVRKSAPSGVVASGGASQDNRLVDVPLKEILTQLRPDAFQRRPDQRRIEVPSEIQDIFGAKGEHKAQMRILQKDELKPIPKSEQPEPTPAPTQMPVYRTPTAGSFTPGPLPPQERIAIAPAAAPPRPAAASAMPPIQRNEFLSFEIAEISANWPETVKRDIQRLGAQRSKCVLPTAEIQEALKQGRVNYTWRQISGRLQPPLASGSQITNDQAVLELPIAAVASAFFTQTQAANANRQAVRPPANIEPVFRGGPAAPPQQPPIPQRPAAPPPAPQLRLQEPAAPAQPAPAPAPRPAAPPAASGRPSKGNVTFKVSDVWANWPEEVRAEANKLRINANKVEIPFELVEPGLRGGKIEYTWREFCGWVQNCPPEAQNSALAESRVDLPLSVVAPLCLRLSPPTQRRADHLDHIPALFGPGSQQNDQDAESDEADEPVFKQAPAPRPAPAPAPAPTPAPRAPAHPPQPTYTPPPPAAHGRAPAADAGTSAKNLAELFNEPGKRNWTPNEIVQRTSQLPGVTGALIALQDGLLVANCMPPNWKTETIAAFLPQIFGRMHQYVKELSMGDLISVTVAVEQGTLQVYKAGIIYFAALARPDATLPLAALNLIARELSRHTK